MTNEIILNKKGNTLIGELAYRLSTYKPFYDFLNDNTKLYCVYEVLEEGSGPIVLRAAQSRLDLAKTYVTSEHFVIVHPMGDL